MDICEMKDLLGWPWNLLPIDWWSFGFVVQIWHQSSGKLTILQSSLLSFLFKTQRKLLLSLWNFEAKNYTWRRCQFFFSNCWFSYPRLLQKRHVVSKLLRIVSLPGMFSLQSLSLWLASSHLPLRAIPQMSALFTSPFTSLSKIANKCFPMLST